MQRIMDTRKRNENTAAIQYWKSYGIATQDASLTDREFEMWIGWLEQDGQLKPGQIKPRDIYTNQFQPSQGQLSRAL